MHRCVFQRERKYLCVRYIYLCVCAGVHAGVHARDGENDDTGRVNNPFYKLLLKAHDTAAAVVD